MTGVYPADRLPRLRSSAVCIGIFDGVHLGHRAIIRRTVKAARALKAPAVGLTFDPHPSRILTPGHPHPLLYSLRHRIVHMLELGLDHCFAIRFNRAFSRMPSGRFIDSVLRRALRAKFVCVGDDFRFGRGAEGNTATLKAASAACGFRLQTVKAVRHGREAVSSTRIRRLVREGSLKEASALLGRPVSLFGTVVRGKGRGTGLGYPTVNLMFNHETLPPEGVYAAKAVCGGNAYRAALHLGPRPTFREQNVTAEAYLLGTSNSFYGKEIELFIVRKIRKVRRFPSAASLRRQIAKDVREVQKSVPAGPRS